MRPNHKRGIKNSGRSDSVGKIDGDDGAPTRQARSGGSCTRSDKQRYKGREKESPQPLS